jgi:ABC-type amino acid transport substrate-binding protein
VSPARRTVATLVALGLFALPGVAVAADAPVPPARPPVQPLVVGLGLANPSLQAGVVRGKDVILARGFEVELARTLARRLGGRVGGFVHASPGRLSVPSTPGWHLALAGLEPSRVARAAADVTVPYLTTDIAVVSRRGLDRPRRLADLRNALLCAVRGSGAARAAASLRPSRAPVLVAGTERLRAALRTGFCDAALIPAVEAGRFVEPQRRVLGPVVGRIARGKGLVALVPRGAGLDVKAVDRELRRLRRDGTLARLAREWLGLDPAALRVLR